MVGQELNTTLEALTGHNMTTAKQVSSTSSLDSSATVGSSNLSFTLRHSPLNEQAQTLMGQPSTLPSTLPQIISSSEYHANNTNQTTVNLNSDSVSLSTKSSINQLPNGFHFNYLVESCTTGMDNKFSNVIPTPVMSSATVSDIETSIAANNSVPEFLYQLTKMLTDDHRDIIEWSNGKIEVHNPHKLESDILNKYFRHSKYASFQRQLNYFGFRKLAGKGKMAPCSYINENATQDLRSLLRMKRKTSSTTKENKGDGDSSSDGKSSKGNSSSSRVLNPLLNGLPPTSSGTKRKRNSVNGAGFGLSAKIAVGKGVKHQLNGFLKSSSSSSTPCHTSSSMTVNNPLLNEATSHQTEGESSASYNNPHTIALSAVGKGVCHQFPYPTQLPSFPSDNKSKSNDSVKVKKESITSTFTFLDPAQLGMGIESSLSELKNNFRNSLNDAEKSDQSETNIMTRESSLVNLAMIPETCSTPNQETIESNPRTSPPSSNNLFTFIDFPCELEPSSDKN